MAKFKKEISPDRQSVSHLKMSTNLQISSVNVDQHHNYGVSDFYFHFYKRRQWPT